MKRISDFLRRIDMLLEWMDKCINCHKLRRLAFFSPHLLWFWRETPKRLKRRDEFERALSVCHALMKCGAWDDVMKRVNSLTAEWSQMVVTTAKKVA